MAFVFEVETGTGSATATSLGSVAEADDYFVTDPVFATTWSAFLTTPKQYRLARASRVLQQKATWRGRKAVDASAFSWPRAGVVDRDNVAIADNIVPVPVKQAVFELIRLLESNDITVGSDVDYLKSIKVDVIDLVFQDKTGQSAIPSIINDILRGLGSLPSGGPRFVPILKT